MDTNWLRNGSVKTILTKHLKQQRNNFTGKGRERATEKPPLYRHSNYRNKRMNRFAVWPKTPISTSLSCFHLSTPDGRFLWKCCRGNELYLVMSSRLIIVRVLALFSNWETRIGKSWVTSTKIRRSFAENYISVPEWKDSPFTSVTTVSSSRD